MAIESKHHNPLSRGRILEISCLIAVLTLSLHGTTALASSPSTKKTAVIVGGGPVGLATALTLSNLPHCYDVVVLEQASVEQYDPTKAYLYNVNARGQKWMRENFPSALQKLQERGSVGSMSKITIVPADPQKPIPGEKTLAQYNVTDQNKNIFEEGQKRQRDEGSQDDSRSYWIPRHSMICLLEDEIQEQEYRRKTLSDAGHQIRFGEVQLKKGRKFTDLQPLDDRLLQVHVQDDSGKMETYSGTLVVAADGYHSSVRDCLANENKKTWLQSKCDQFKVKRWASPATGLRMKVIQMPPGFSIPDSDGSRLPTESERTYAIRGVNKGFRNFLSLGFLPVRDPSMVRPANVITRPNHEVWELEDGRSAKKWFQKTFPRLNWDDYVDDKEWERFAKAKGTSFPYCQYSPGLQVTSPDQTCGVALVGDAAHAFPPDIGQGINAGLSDVVALDRALRGRDIISGEVKKEPEKLGVALTEYEKVQKPEVRALIKISRFGFPYQYRQSLLKDRIGRILLTSNIAFRMILNKLTFGLVPPPAIMLLQNSNLTYRQVMRRADITTAGLSALTVTLFWKFFGTGIKRLLGLA